MNASVANLYFAYIFERQRFVERKISRFIVLLLGVWRCCSIVLLALFPNMLSSLFFYFYVMCLPPHHSSSEDWLFSPDFASSIVQIPKVLSFRPSVSTALSCVLLPHCWTPSSVSSTDGTCLWCDLETFLKTIWWGNHRAHRI